MGEAARQLYDDATAMLAQIVEEKWLTANAVIGLWPANAVGHDDIEVYSDETRCQRIGLLHTLRQQIARDGRRANTALADFIAPKESKLPADPNSEWGRKRIDQFIIARLDAENLRPSRPASPA